MLTVEEVKGFKLFTGLNEPDLEQIAKLCTIRTYEANSVICEPNAPATELYILTSGNDAVQIGIPLHTRKTKLIIHNVSKGETFGWAAIVPPYLRTASATCIETAKVVCINGKKLLELLEKNNHLGYVIMKNLSGLISSRLADTTVVLRYEVEKISAPKS